MRQAAQSSPPFDLGLAHFARGETFAARGTVESAVAVLERGLAFSRAADAHFQISMSTGWLGYAYALVGRVDEGVTLLDQSVAKTEALEFTAGLALMWLQGRTYLRAGRRHEAHAAARRGLELCRRVKRRGAEVETLHVLGEIAATASPLDADGAEAHYRQAMALARQRGMRPLIAHCHLGLGKLYHRTDKREQAQEHLATATTMYREMGMTYWLERAEAERRGRG